MARTGYKKSSESSSITKEDLNSLIAKKAYELFEKRGRQAGHSMDDWLEAERLVRAKLSK